MKLFTEKHKEQMMGRISKEYPGFEFTGYYKQGETNRIIQITDFSYGGKMMVEYFVNQSTGRLKGRTISYL